MTQAQRKWNRLSEEQRKSAIDSIILFFEQERDEKIGVLVAEQLLEFFLQTVGSAIYNRGISDAKEALEQRFDDLRYDLDDLFDL